MVKWEKKRKRENATKRSITRCKQWSKRSRWQRILQAYECHLSKGVTEHSSRDVSYRLVITLFLFSSCFVPRFVSFFNSAAPVAVMHPYANRDVGVSQRKWMPARRWNVGPCQPHAHATNCSACKITRFVIILLILASRFSPLSRF